MEVFEVESYKISSLEIYSDPLSSVNLYEITPGKVKNYIIKNLK